MHITRMKRLLSGIALSALLTAGPAAATELVYQPINPSFGGNPLNESYLLNMAQSQDNNKDPDIKDEADRNTLEDFTQTLQNRILSAIAAKITDGLLGEEGGLSGGNYTVGNYEIEIVDSLDSYTVVITDNLTGNSTTVELPTF